MSKLADAFKKKMPKVVSDDHVIPKKSGGPVAQGKNYSGILDTLMKKSWQDNMTNDDKYGRLQTGGAQNLSVDKSRKEKGMGGMSASGVLKARIARATSPNDKKYDEVRGTKF